MSENHDNSIRGICARVYDRLADDIENPDTWTKCQVETAVIDSMWMLSIIRPGLFTSTEKIELAANRCTQTLPESCRSVSEFSCIEIDGEIIPVQDSEFSTIEAMAYHPPSRRKRTQSNLVSAYHVGINPNNPRSFAVTPMIQAGQKAILYAECVSIAEFQEDTCAELPEELRPYILPIIELALYQLYATDRESPEVAALANASLSAFTNLAAITNAAVNAAMQQLRREAEGG